MRLPAPPRPRFDEQRLLPLINVVFLLLVFFMLAGALASPSPFPLVPPRTQSAAAAEALPEALFVSADGRVALGAQTLAADELDAALARWHAAHAGAALQLRADARAEAVQVIDLLARLRAQGIARVQLLSAQGAP